METSRRYKLCMDTSCWYKLCMETSRRYKLRMETSRRYKLCMETSRRYKLCMGLCRLCILKLICYYITHRIRAFRSVHVLVLLKSVIQFAKHGIIRQWSHLNVSKDRANSNRYLHWNSETLHSVPQCPFLLATCFIAHTLLPAPPHPSRQNSSRGDISIFPVSAPRYRSYAPLCMNAVHPGCTQPRRRWQKCAQRQTRHWTCERQKLRVAGSCTVAVAREGQYVQDKL
jgi:hypothetical protein